ncbi:Sec-independent protein translocase subunit TatA/TatB [Sphingopyxis microcysteis]|uniref:Sec-independent protein translocase subunit TatA/TatB n=1 Tax=Sphingopyxis microcysteis TaxID=2484145 RepID=UPI001446D895|nr:hypothetical protein [Sphingopyxis microcysteis]
MSASYLAIFGSGFILFLAHALPWFMHDDGNFVRNPAKLAALLSGLQVIPHYFVVTIWPEESMIFPFYGDGLLELLPRFALYYAAGFAFMIWGIRRGMRGIANQSTLTIDYEPNYYLISALMFTLYILAMYLMIDKVGGLNVFIQNFGNQTEFQSGTGIFQIIKLPAVYLSILFLAVQHAKTGKPHLLWIILYILIVIAIESGLGGRRTPIQIILFAIASIYIINPERRLLSFTNVGLFAVCVTIFVVILNIRDSASGYTEERDAFSYFINFSYNDIYIFVIDHFSRNDFWYGKIFLDFQYRFTGGHQGLPPPSLDDGVYIYNLYLGRFAEPPMSLELMAQNSWPPRTFGNGYMNFGFQGILLFFFLQGLVTGWTYKLVVRTGFNPVFVFVYLILIFSFQMSNLKFTEMALILVGLLLIFGPAALINRWLPNARRGLGNTPQS